MLYTGRLKYTINYIIQLITKHSANRIFWSFSDYFRCGNQYYVLECNLIYFIRIQKPPIFLLDYVLGVLPHHK